MVTLPVEASRQRFVVVLMLFVVVVINFLDRTNISIVAPSLAADLKLTPFRMGLVFSAFGWSYALLQIPASRFVDRVHPRILYTVVLGAWSLATVALGLVHSFVALVALRIIIGAFEAPSYPINNRIAATWFGENERAGAIGFYTSGQFVGIAFLAPLLTWILAEHGWRAVFIFTGAVGLAWAAVWFTFYRNPREFPGVNQAEIEWIRTHGGMPELSDRPPAKKGIVWADLKTVLSKRSLWGMYIGQFGVVSTQWFFLTWFPTYLFNSRHREFAKSGLQTAIPFFFAFIGVLAGGFCSDWMLRRGMGLTTARKFPIIAGLLLSTSIVGANYAENQVWLIAFFSSAFFGSGFASITWSLVATMAPAHLIGLTGGVFNFFGNLAAIVVPIAVGALVRGSDFKRPLIFVAATALVGALSYLVLVGKIEQAPATSEP